MPEIRPRKFCGLAAKTCCCRGVIMLLMAAAWAAQAVQKVPLTWDPVDNAAGYYIYYGKVPGSYTSRLDAGTNTTAIIPGLVEGGTYNFAVSAYGEDGAESGLSGEIVFIVPGVIAVVPGSPSQAAMHLTFPVAPSHSYEVQASDNLATWATIYQTFSATNSWINFSDPAANKGSSRFYRLVLH